MFPARFKGVNYYNYPKIFDAAFSVIKVFLKEKIKKRVSFAINWKKRWFLNNFDNQQKKILQLTFHGSNISSVYKEIPKSILPSEYGGDAGPIGSINGRKFY